MLAFLGGKWIRITFTLHDILLNTEAEKGPLETDCLLWLGSEDSYGYPQLWNTSERKNKRLSRSVYELKHNVQLLAIEFILHKCDTPMCINPEHLYLGSAKDNAADILVRSRQGKRAKLTDEDVIEIRRAYHAGEANMPELARSFGISNPTVSAIIRREFWKHLP